MTRYAIRERAREMRAEHYRRRGVAAESWCDVTERTRMRWIERALDEHIARKRAEREMGEEMGRQK